MADSAGGGRLEPLSRRDLILGAGAGGAMAWAGPSTARVPDTYPRSYAALQAQAKREGRLTVYSTSDIVDMDGILKAFHRQNPDVQVGYQHLVSTDLYNRYLGELGQGAPSADLLFSSAMDVQIKLVNDGYAQAYASPEKANLPPWAVWKNQAFGVTAEPIVMAYNRRLLSPTEAPRSHDQLEHLLRTKGAAYAGKVGTYDIARSSTGFLFFTQDLEINHDTWSLVRSLGRTRPVLDVFGHDILARVSSGQQLIAYNMMSSYALERRALDPWVEVVFPEDYTLVMSRIAFISKEARNPSAAKLFLDFLLSSEGQALFAQRYMAPVRLGTAPSSPHANPQSQRAIHVGPALLANLDRLKYARLIAQWRKTLSA